MEENEDILPEPDSDFTAPDVDSNFLVPPEAKICGFFLSEVKQYLRVDFDDDDLIIEAFLFSAEKTCLDILRTTSKKKLENDPNGKVAMLYYVAHLYENREKANHQELTKTLRALLFGSRREVF